eukprot:scaffold249647_cov17-Tisochrysis_lutea.AAC.1
MVDMIFYETIKDMVRFEKGSRGKSMSSDVGELPASETFFLWYCLRIFGCATPVLFWFGTMSLSCGAALPLLTHCLCTPIAHPLPLRGHARHEVWAANAIGKVNRLSSGSWLDRLTMA